MPTLREGQAIVHLLKTEPPGKPAWLTFNCKDTSSLSHGESFAEEAVPLAFEVWGSLFARVDRRDHICLRKKTSNRIAREFEMRFVKSLR